jgi:hypothetical protein
VEFDLYGGAAWIEKSDLGVRGQDNNAASVNLTNFDVDTNTGFTVGTRASYWLNPLPFLGFDLDPFYMQIPVPAQTTTATGSFSGEFLGKPISARASGGLRPERDASCLPRVRAGDPAPVAAAGRRRVPQGPSAAVLHGRARLGVQLKKEHIVVEFGSGRTLRAPRAAEPEASSPEDARRLGGRKHRG